MPRIYHKTSGSWQNIARVYHKTNSAWENIQAVWHKAGGVWQKVFSGAVTPTIQTKPVIGGTAAGASELAELTATSYHWYDTDVVSYSWQRSIDESNYSNITSYQTTSNPAVGSSLSYAYTVPQSSMYPAERNYFKFASRGYNNANSTLNTELSSNSVYIEMPRDVTNFLGTINGTTATLTWNVPQYANRQEIQYKQSSSNTWITIGGYSGYVQQFTLSNLAYATSYDFRIRGWTGSVGSSTVPFTGYYGNWSNTITLTAGAANVGAASLYYFTSPDYTGLYYSANYATSYYLNVYDQTTSSNAYGFPMTISSSSTVQFTYDLIRGHVYTATVYGINSMGNGPSASKTFTVPNYIDLVDSATSNLHFAKIFGTTAKLGYTTGTYYGAQSSRSIEPKFDSTHPIGQIRENKFWITANGQNQSSPISTASSYTLPNDLGTTTGEAIYASSLFTSSSSDYVYVETPWNVVIPYISDFTLTNNDNGSFTVEVGSNIHGAPLKGNWILRYGTQYPLTPNNSSSVIPVDYSWTQTTSETQLLYVEVTPFYKDTNNANIYGESVLHAVYVTNTPPVLPYTPIVSADNALSVGGTFYWYSSNATDYIWTVYNPDGTINGTFSVSPGTGTRTFWSPAVQGTWKGAGNYTLYVYAHNSVGYSSVASITQYMS